MEELFNVGFSILTYKFDFTCSAINPPHHLQSTLLLQIWVKMNDYEKMRLKNIEENKARMRAAGIFKSKKALDECFQSKIAQLKGKKNLVEEDEDYMSSGGSEELSFSSEEENNMNKEESIIAERSIGRNKRRLNMSDVIADATRHDKNSQSFNKSQPNTRSRVAPETRSRTNLNDRVTYGDGLTMPVTRMHQANLDTEVMLFQSPMENAPQKSQQGDAILDDIPLYEEEPEGTTDVTKLTKKGRTWAKPWSAWDNGYMKILEWNDKCQPLGPLEPKLMSHLGNLARNGDLFPLTMLSWRDVDKTVLDNIWESVKANTNAPEGFKDICFKKMGVFWKHFKHRIKEKYYKKLQTNEERLAIVPPRVEADQWPILVHYWGLPKTQRRAIQNSKNRESQCAYSRTGRTPHAIIIDGMKKQGKPVDQITIWRETRNPKNKSFNTEDGALHRAEHLERQLNELSEEERNDPELRNKIFMDVVGRDGHGHALLKGVGTKITSRESNVSSSTLMDEIAQLRKEAEDRDVLYKQVIEEREALHKKDVEEQEARHQQELQKIKAEMRDELISLMRNAGMQVLEDTPSTSVNHD